LPNVCRLVVVIVSVVGLDDDDGAENAWVHGVWLDRRRMVLRDIGKRMDRFMVGRRERDCLRVFSMKLRVQVGCWMLDVG